MMEDALIIFVRNPELGKVKTRIAKTAGDEKALSIYKALLQHTFDITWNLNADCFVFYSDAIQENDIWSNSKYKKHVQQGITLGDRMLHAFEKVFARGYKRVCIIGSDCFALDTGIIHEAFQHLKSNNIVIGPALDGGYYLLGMQQLYAPIFQLTAWSSDTVFNETLQKVEELKLCKELLITLSDIDTEADWNDRHKTVVLPIAKH